ncbi:CLUMA_CG013960, isoform A [Clunio marinus]|uniref:CLUMA_CG013960, isoform A n=1 Tax=Clunio marinus TaxID=568069 RepID=A0A1J1IKE1_9DIPT|nr:CLUMA_CG013960, isoform A [Clunio marinus]
MFLRILNSNNIRKRLFGGLLLFVLSFIIYVNFNQNVKNCYFDITWKDGRTLRSVAENSRLESVVNPKNIFFHETSCSLDGIVKMNSRQACAVESAALMNPGHQVYVLFTSQVGFRNTTQLPIIDALLSYPNIHFNYLNLTQYAAHTPLAKWMKSQELFKSHYVNSHTSDILRYLSLWKYSGTYLDLDVVVLKSFDSINTNFAGAESNNFVAAGIINLENDSGHKIADMCVKDLLKNFNGADWGNNGPGVITRVCQEICHTKNVSEMITMNNCENFHVLPIESCYSIRWPEHIKFFKKEFLNETLQRLNHSIIAHVWNKHSAATPLNVNSNVAYINLAKRYCPKVVAVSEFF